MKRALVLLVAALLAGPALGQTGRAAMDVTRETVNVDGSSFSFTTIPPPSSATLGCVGVFLGSPLNLQCAPSSGIVYTVATKSLDVTDGRVQAGNLRAIPLPASGSVTVTNQGTAGATTYTYSLQACLADGSCNAAGTASTTTTGNATLSATDFNRLSWSGVSGSALYKIRRDVGGATQGVIWSGTALTVDDTGLAGDSSAKPTTDGTGVVAGDRLVGVATLGAGSTIANGTGTATATLSGVLHVNATPATTTGTAEQILMTYTLPANTLSANGKGIRLRVIGRHAANTNSVLLRIYRGGLDGTWMNSVSLTNTGAAVLLTLDFVRTGAATAVYGGQNAYSSVSTTNVGALAFDPTVANTFDVAATTGTAAGDVTVLAYIVEALN